MITTLVKKIFGTKNEREIRRLQPIVAAINDLEPQMRQLSDFELAAKTNEFKERLSRGATLDELLIEAFAVVREAARRTLNMRHFDVQLMGGIVLHEGKIAEMKTGEGKTLVATLPAYLNALEGKGVHIVTVNDYLAKRDTEWMGKVYRFLGLTVGTIVHDMDDNERRKAYACDITYGTNNEFGFDYLRDNMKFRLEDCVQRGHNYAIIDEVDSILIDEARTPLIISGPSEESTELYYRVDKIIPKLVRGEVIEGKEPGERYTTGDYTVDEKHKTVALTEEGVAKVEKLLGIDNLYDPANITILHHVIQALKAHTLFKRDRDYVVKDGKVIIVDEFTGRLMPGRRWSDGLHQAIEAKEGLKIERENQTLATITFQNYFRMYKKLAGMTGTAETEAAEFSKIYGLEVVVIPTNKPLIRIEYPDVVYRTEEEKFRAVVREVQELHKIGRPVLIGTTSVEKSEKLSAMLKKAGIKHEVLNAKHHEREAYIIAQAGRKGAVTVATNMAGRGTDILLGGNPEFLTKEYFRKQGRDPDQVPKEEWDEVFKRMKEQTDKEHEEVVKLGGLHIIGTERHESRRIDNQLRGRAGRQGDPGSSRFYLSLEDDLLRIFGGDRIKDLMLRLGMEEDVPIESKLITKRIEAAQKAVEAQNFAARKHLLEYDDVMNKQREAIYGWRRKILEREDMKEKILEMVRAIVAGYIESRLPENSHPSTWDWAGLQTDILSHFGVRINTSELEGLPREEIEEIIYQKLVERYEEKEKLIGPELMREAERMIMLHVIDSQWKDHLLSMDHLKEGIGLRGYGQKDPLIEYKKESFLLFQEMMERIEDETVRLLFFLQPQVETRMAPVFSTQVTLSHSDEVEEVPEMALAAAPVAAARSARASVEDFTRNIQRKKERELAELQFVGSGTDTSKPKPIVKGKKVGRNDPCPCGSGKKYKKCCGAR